MESFKIGDIVQRSHQTHTTKTRFGVVVDKVMDDQVKVRWLHQESLAWTNPKSQPVDSIKLINVRKPFIPYMTKEHWDKLIDYQDAIAYFSLKPDRLAFSVGDIVEGSNKRFGVIHEIDPTRNQMRVMWLEKINENEDWEHWDCGVYLLSDVASVVIADREQITDKALLKVLQKQSEEFKQGVADYA